MTAIPPRPSTASAARRPPAGRGLRILRLALAVGAILYLSLLVRAAQTPLGGWLLSFVAGTGVRWEEAYRALESPETLRGGGSAERERLLLANAMAESEPPRGLQIGRRLHPAGTLAHLRYETFDVAGKRIDAWEARALVPALPYWTTPEAERRGEDGPLGRIGCPAACREGLERDGGVLLARSGQPGLAAEWVLRMPRGESFDLGPPPLVTQDLLAATPHSVPLESHRQGDRSVRWPDAVRVTLLEACPARVRVGAVAHLAFHENAIVPIPRELVTEHWVQMDGCDELAHAQIAESTLSARPGTPAGAGAPAILPQRETGTGFASLRLDDGWFARRHASVSVELVEICRYDPAGDRWRRVPWQHAEPSLFAPLAPDAQAVGERTFLDLPRKIALFGVRWSETEVPRGKAAAAGPGAPVPREALLPSGPVLCEDLHLGPPPPGRVAACVPFGTHAEARFVPLLDCAD